MRCSKCDYSLFDIRERVCPECGEAFSLQDRIFEHCGVRFCCPHCDQQYYGTDDNGHLVPQRFACLRCHNTITMSEMIVRSPLHTVLRRRDEHTFPGVAGVVLIICGIIGGLAGIVALSDAFYFVTLRGFRPSQLSSDSVSELIDVLLSPGLMVGGYRLAERRKVSRSFLLAWSGCQLVAAFAFIAFGMASWGISGIFTMSNMVRELKTYGPPVIPALLLLVLLLDRRIAAKFRAFEHPPT